MASFDDYIKMYERLNQQFVSFAPSYMDSLSPEKMEPINTFNEIAYSPIQEMLDRLAYDYSSSIAATHQSSDSLAANFQRIIPSGISRKFENLNTFSIEQFNQAFNPLFSAIDNIRVFPDYIEIPNELIPQKLFPQAIPSENVSGNSPIKKLSRDQALAIISILLSIMFWILNNVSPASWQQKYYDEISQSLEKQNNLLEESNQIQAERAQIEKEQLQATKEQTQILKTIAYLLEIQDNLVSPETVDSSESSATDSGALAADPKAVTAEIGFFPDDEPHSTLD
jgi:hypothetical protein